MAAWAAYPSHHYFDHIHRDTITATAGWQALDSPLSQLRFLAGRYFDVWARLTFRPEVDNVDATGVTAVVPLTMTLCAAAGIALSLWRRRSALVLFGLSLLLLAPLASVFTVDGVTRRTFVMAPFVAVFAAVGVVELARLVRERWPGTPWFGPALAAMFVAAMAWQNLYGYFGLFAGSPAERWVFVDDYVAAVTYIHSLPSGDYVYFYSERLSFNYEPRRYLAPDARGMDRSSQFGDGSIATEPGAGRPVFVLLGNYRSLLPAIRERYPGGATVTGPGHDPSFIAYSPR
jgi:hypothetical protein